MKAYEVDKIRNVGLVGHQDTGKTTFLEVVLFETKQVTRLSKVDDGNSNLDFAPEEIDRRLTMKAALESTGGLTSVAVLTIAGSENILMRYRKVVFLFWIVTRSL